MLNSQLSAPSVPPSIPISAKPTVLEILQQHRLGSSATAVLLLLSEHAWGVKDHCWPSVPRLAQLLGKTDRTVQRALSELKRAGLVQEIEADNRTGRVLVLTWKVTPGDKPVTPFVSSNVTPSVTFPSPHGDKSDIPPVKKMSPESLNEKFKETTNKTRDDVVPFLSCRENQKDSDYPDYSVPLPDYPLDEGSEDEEEESPDWWDDDPTEIVLPLPKTVHRYFDSLLTNPELPSFEGG